uniref:MAM domain-containing protein n=1 Tax=Enterobius vermicularis TaxID=51028 RepID=A0A0N4VKF5_ENTVE
LYAVNSIYDWCVFEVIVVFPGQDCFRQDTFRLTTQRIQLLRCRFLGGYGASVYEPVGGFPLGPFRSEANSASITSVSALNCHSFSETCRWSNTNEDELDWKVKSAAPESAMWSSSLNSAVVPDQGASVLFSSSGNGWEVGQLVSDQIPCMTMPLRLTATVWRTGSGVGQQQPVLQICSRNVRSDMPVSNCQKFPSQNGVPVTVDVPLPHDPLSPTQIILLGTNFAGLGGAIFVQDIIVEGRLEQDCALVALDNRVEGSEEPQRKEADNNYMSIAAVSPYMQQLGTAKGPARMPNSINDAVFELFYDTCITLSCNPAESECRWYAGKRGWITAATQRFSNPLTGVQGPPPGFRGFLVAPFTAAGETVYQMTSPRVTVASGTTPTYFCFYEFFHTEGARLSICTDKSERNCFYTRNEIDFEDLSQNEVCCINICKRIDLSDC